MSAAVAVIAGSALVTFAIKAAGPVAFGGRPLPGWFSRVVMFLGPPVLAALVVTQTLADGQRLAVGADTVGVLVAGLVAWRTRSVIASVVVAAVVTAVLRAV